MSSIQYLVKDHAITAAQSIAQRGKTHKLPDECAGLTVQCNLVSGTGGTTVKCYIQTTLDGGTTWVDIMAFAFTTSDANKILSVREETAIVADHVVTAGALADDTAVSGIIGDRVRAMVVTTGTYTGAELDVHMRIEHGNN